MKIEDVMSRHIYVANVSSTVSELAKKMREYQVGFLPIHKENKIIGIVTDRDIVIEMLANDVEKDIESYIQKNMISIEKDMDTKDALVLMTDHKIKRLLVTDNRKVVGILSLSDLLNQNHEDLIKTIKTIFTRIENERMKSAEIDSFYL